MDIVNIDSKVGTGANPGIPGGVRDSVHSFKRASIGQATYGGEPGWRFSEERVTYGNAI